MSDQDASGKRRNEDVEKWLAKQKREMEERDGYLGGLFPVVLMRQQFFDVIDLLKQLSTPRHVGRVWWTSESGAAPIVTAGHLNAVKDCLGQLAAAIKVAAWP